MAQFLGVSRENLDNANVEVLGCTPYFVVLMGCELEANSLLGFVELLEKKHLLHF